MSLPLRLVLSRLPCQRILTSASKGLASLPPVLNACFDCSSFRRRGTSFRRRGTWPAMPLLGMADRI
eukprot:1840942-Pyramimonas_sp.AAC.1